MKRINNLFEPIISLENLRLAYEKARQGKGNTYGVRLYEKDLENNLQQLQMELSSGTYRTSEYAIFTIHEPKERMYTFKDTQSLTQIEKLPIQLDFFFGTGSGCQAGFCTD